MFKRILVPLDGSEHAESIGGFVAGLARPLGAEVVLLRVIEPDKLALPGAAPAHSQAAREHAPQDTPGREWPAPGITSRGGMPERVPGFGTQIIDREMELATNYLAKESRRMDAAGVGVSNIVRVGSPAETIVRYAREAHADMIAMATHRESALARGVLGSVTDRVLHSTPVPLLTVHPSKLTAFEGNAGAPNVIIVPLDGSQLSEGAVPKALDIAEDCAADIVFIRAVRFPYYGVAGPGVEYYPGDIGIEEQRKETLAYLGRFVQVAADKNIKARAHAAIGAAAARITEEADATEGALIVMATHGAGGLKRWVIGSVTDKVVRASGTPVLVLPPETAERAFGH